MKKYEYRIEDRFDQGPDVELAFLNDLGAEGWRVTFRSRIEKADGTLPEKYRFWFERDIVESKSFLDELKPDARVQGVYDKFDS